MMKTRPKSGEIPKSTDQYARKSSIHGKSGNENGRFSKRLLHDIRNRIPIEQLIKMQLGIRHYTDNGIFRFECPLCASFHTSVKKDTNLARCFNCRANLNTIEMVMEVKKVRFRQSVNYLIPFLNEPLKTQVIHHTGRAEDIRHVSTSAGRPSSDDLSALEQVLRSLPEVNGSLSNQQLSESRIQSLEKEMEKLKKRMDQFYQFIVREFQKRL